MLVQGASVPGSGTSRLKARLYDALHRPHTPAYRVTLRLTFFLIILSVLTIIVETAPSIYEPFAPLIETLELLILAAFSAEYLANLYVAEDRRKYVLSWWGIIDLLAILPGFMGLFQLRGLTFLRELRVLRVLRMLKLMKVAATRTAEANAQASQRKHTIGLDVQIYAICFFTVVIISSTLVYHVERDIPGTHFTSIPEAMWWAVTTVTTTGYGDYIPQTLLGRLFAAATMLAGLALFSLLTSVVGRALLTSLFGSAPEDGESTAPPPRRPSLMAATQTPAQTGGAANGAVPAPSATNSASSSASAQRLRERAATVARQATQHFSLTRVVGTSEAEVARGPLGRLAHAFFVDTGSALYTRVQSFITVLIFGSVALVVLESVPALHDGNEALFHVLDWIVVVVFALEYLAYMYLAHDKRKYAFSFWGVVDLVAVLPTFVTFAAALLPVNLTAIKIVRMLRVLRILRTLKLAKLAADRAQKSSSRRQNTFSLDLQIYFIALFTAVVISSTLMYFVELEVPETKFLDIPSAMWWSIVTITTTGYGDMVPSTFIGRVISGATMVTGLALFGILTSVIGRAMLSSLFGVDDDFGHVDGETASGPAYELPIATTLDLPAPADPSDLELITRLMRENEQLRLERDRLRTTAGT